MDQKDSNHSTPFIFGTAIWGKEFCDNFMNHCLSTLLADGNIPALPYHEKSKFIFCTTPDDWENIQSHPLFPILSKYLAPDFMPLMTMSEENSKKRNELLAHKYHIVTLAHSNIVNRMYEEKSIGSLIFPDHLYSVNSLKNAYTHIKTAHIKMVLSHCPRLCNPNILTSLQRLNYFEDGAATNIANRDLIYHALSNMNTEILAQKWDNLFAFDFITDIWLPLGKKLNEGFVSHSFAWCPIFTDYSKMTTHNTTCLEQNTIDGSYLFENFIIDDVHLITDSDEFGMISYSPHTMLRTEYKFSHPIKKINDDFKIAHWKGKINMSMGGYVDPLKLEIFKTPSFIHSGSLTRESKSKEKYTRSIVNKILANAQPQDGKTYHSKKLGNLYDKIARRVFNYKKPISNASTEIDKLIAEYTILTPQKQKL